MIFLNSLQSYFSSISLWPKNLTFFEQFALDEIEPSPANLSELRKQLDNLTLSLEKASPEEMEKAFKLLNQVKEKILTSGISWEENFKDLERKFIQADLISWENIPETRGKTSEASKRILSSFDDNFRLLNIENLNLNFLPGSIGQLSQLPCLYVSWNQLKSVPKSFEKLTQLPISST